MKTILLFAAIFSFSGAAHATDFGFPPTPQKQTVAHVSAQILNEYRAQAPELVSETKVGNDQLLTVTDGKTAYACHSSETQIYDCVARGQEELALPNSEENATSAILYRALALRASIQKKPTQDTLFVHRFEGLRELAFNLFDGNYYFSCSEIKETKAHSCQFQYFPDKEKSPLR